MLRCTKIVILGVLTFDNTLLKRLSRKISCDKVDA